jgi:transposase
MAYDEKYRVQAVSYKDSGHTFKQLKETFKIDSSTYYKWKRNKEATGSYVPPMTQKATRKRKINPKELELAVKEKPDAYLRELAEKFNCSINAVHKRLKQLKITYKKRHLPIGKNLKNIEPNISSN